MKIDINHQGIRMICGGCAFVEMRAELPSEWTSLEDLEDYAHARAEEDLWIEGLCPVCAKERADDIKGDCDRMIEDTE